MITQGTSCDTSSSDYSKDPSMCAIETPDPDSVTIKIETLRESGAESVSTSAHRVDNGCTAEENEGKTVIIFDENSNAVGCGILEEEAEDKVLVAEMGTYTGYEGDKLPSGYVVVTFNADGTFTFQFSLSGLLANCVDCGIHIHAGTSCESHELVKGHGWNSLAVKDLWFAKEGAVYQSDKDGSAEGYFSLTNGFGYEPNLNHAVVIHTAGGARVGCGLLK